MRLSLKKHMDNSRTNKNPVYLLWVDGIFILLGSKIRTSFQDIDLRQQVSEIGRAHV